MFEEVTPTWIEVTGVFGTRSGKLTPDREGIWGFEQESYSRTTMRSLGAIYRKLKELNSDRV